MIIHNCKTNHLMNPIGYDMTTVVLTWVTTKTHSTKQTQARIIVATDPQMEIIVYDTGYQDNLDSRGVEIPLILNPYTRYFWTVTVMGNEGDEATSEIHFFETGKMADTWSGQWITTSWEDQTISPYMRKTFSTKKQVSHARVYIIGLGLYEFEINGHRVGNERFTPYCNAYDAWLQYQTFDVTPYLAEGNNAVGVLLGNGWAKGRFGMFGPINSPYINEFALRFELHITYQDGETEIINSDTSWMCHPSPIVEDSIYDGEIYDANLDLDHWSLASYNTSNWEQTRDYTPANLGPVVDRMSPPVIIKEELSPITLLNTPAGEQVLDMGQNMVGWLKFKVHEPKGTLIKISYGEVLQDENFYRENLKGAKAEYVYISDGQEHIVEPHFTYYGFRYAKLEGFTNPIQLENFTGCVVYSDLETIGHIETSDPLVNQLFSNALWSQKGNFLDVPTDCPQRDERLGWTGDAQIFSGTALFNMNAYAFYRKFMRDVYEEQKFSGGMVPNTVPTFMKNKQTESGFLGGGASAWADAATVIPWQAYIHTGDPTILKCQYQSMKDWVDWIITQDKNSGDNKLWTVGFQFGDWLALDGPVEGGMMGGTDTDLIASAYYRLSTNILAKTAKVLGNEKDTIYYGNLSEEIKKAIQNEFFSKTGRSTVRTQTAHVVALHFDLVEEEVKSRVLNDLKALLKQTDMHLETGFVGTPYLCRTLSDHGASDEAYQIFMQKDYPSWLYEVIMGATTIWERWNSILPDGKISDYGMNSLNHYAYGSIIEWVYRNVCGLKPIEETPGFKEFIIHPMINGKLQSAKVSLNSAMGIIQSKWQLLENDQIKLDVKIPFNTTATIVLSDTLVNTVTCSQNNITMKQSDTDVIITASPGTFSFTYTSQKSYKVIYSLSTPIWELKSSPKTYNILEKLAPGLLTLNQEAIGAELPYSIQELLDSGDDFKIGMILQGLDINLLAEALLFASS